MEFATPSKVILNEIRVRKDATIIMRASSGFFSVLKSRSGNPTLSLARVEDFDFFEYRKGIYHGVGDEGSDFSHAQRVASRVLSMYRVCLTLEAVFPTSQDYHNWLIFNRRSPSSQDLVELCKTHGVRIPFLALPFKAETKPPLYKTQLVQKLVVPPAPPAPPKLTSQEKPVPSPEALQALVSRFSRP